MRKLYPILFAALLVTVSCRLENHGFPGGKDTEPPEILTVRFEKQEDESFLFETNDPANKGTAGKTFFCYDPEIKANGAFTYTVRVNKSFGDRNGGYGVVFQRIDARNFWVFNIDTQGYYYLAKVSDGSIIEVFSPAWKQSDFIYKGHGSPNVIRVEFDGSTGYTVFANDNQVVSFLDKDYKEALKDGCFGVDAVVMPTEQFPGTPVKVSYEILEPSGIDVSSAPGAAPVYSMMGDR